MSTYTTAAGTFDKQSVTWADIAGVPTATTGWRCTNILELLRPAPKRGTRPTIIPGADGVVANPAWNDGTERVLVFKVFSDLDRNNVATGGGVEGLAENLAYLRSVWGVVPGNADSTVTVELHVGTDVYSGDAQLLELDWSERGMPALATAGLRLFLPAGELTL